MRPRAIWRAYQAANDALSRPCECGASPGSWCTKADGRVARIPHLSRAKAGHTWGTSTTVVAPEAHDFGEPRHQLEVP